MPQLTHQIIVPSKIAPEFEGERSFTDVVLHRGFVWHLCPMILADEQFWVLVAGAFGFIQWIEDATSAKAVEDGVLHAIMMTEPPDRIEHTASISLKPKDMTWRISDGLPAHVGAQLKRLRKALRSCRDICDADEAIAEINSKPLKVGNTQFTPQEAMEGLMEELADEYAAYAQSTPFHKRLRDFLTGQTPWLDV